jgi:hypothetical protein
MDRSSAQKSGSDRLSVWSCACLEVNSDNIDPSLMVHLEKAGFCEA